jgi:hypothetical protein
VPIAPLFMAQIGTEGRPTTNNVNTLVTPVATYMIEEHLNLNSLLPPFGPLTQYKHKCRRVVLEHVYRVTSPGTVTEVSKIDMFVNIENVAYEFVFRYWFHLCVLQG